MKTCPVCDTPFPDQHKICPTDGAVLIESRELAPGHIVRNKYRIVRKLGQGGMGVVYLAEHLMLGGEMALKFLATELSRNPQFVKRFRNEARAAYQLRHPNIIEVTDLDQEEDGSLFIAMEYMAGPSLRSALREAKGALPVDRALRIARGLAAGLAAAHARGAVHRDIKPENILLGIQEDGSEQAKVLDFGIAVMTEGITDLSRTHGVLLTPEYAAPEQWRGTPAKELDGRTDLYALGGVMYEMLSGRTPFLGVNPHGWMFQHLQGVPEPLGLLRPDLTKAHPGLADLVMRLLAREREERFPSASALLDALALKPPAKDAQPAAKPVAEVTRSPAPMIPPIPATPPREIILKTAAPAPRSPRIQNVIWAILAALIIVGVGVWFGARLFQPKPATAVPALTPTGGTYSEARPVAISDATPQTTIHYTVDGRAPTEASPVYSRPLGALPSGTVVRAIATAVGHSPSSDVTGVYIWSRSAQPPVDPQEVSAYDQGKQAYDRKQYAEARRLFAQSCDSGELRACNYLGFLYARSLGGTQDAEKARAIYQKACDGGNLSSCASLGSLDQDAGNKTEARTYFKKACDGGLAEGCSLLRGTQ